MYYVKFCRAPSNYWVGSVMYKNGTYFVSGNTMEELYQHAAKRLYNLDRVPRSLVQIESRQSLPSEMPIDKMSKTFKTRFWLPKNVVLESPGEIAAKEPVVITKTEKPAKIKYDYHTYKIVNGKLIVYGVCKLAEYALDANTDVIPEEPDEVPRKKITISDLELPGTSYFNNEE